MVIQFQENAQTERRSEGRIDPILQDPSGYCQGSKKFKLGTFLEAHDQFNEVFMTVLY